MKMLLVALQLSLFSQVPVQAPEKKDPAPPVEKKKVQVFDFEDTTIECEFPAPELDYFQEYAHGPRRPLVRVRDNFDDKVMQSVEEM
jgi:hypothetical protein